MELKLTKKEFNEFNKLFKSDNGSSLVPLQTAAENYAKGMIFTIDEDDKDIVCKLVLSRSSYKTTPNERIVHTLVCDYLSDFVKSYSIRDLKHQYIDAKFCDEVSLLGKVNCPHQQKAKRRLINKTSLIDVAKDKMSKLLKAAKTKLKTDYPLIIVESKLNENEKAAFTKFGEPLKITYEKSAEKTK